jgi:hypothetical protein
MKMKLKMIAVLAVPMLAAFVARANAAESAGFGGREVAAPPWSAACTTDQGPSPCGEPMWVYGYGGPGLPAQAAIAPEQHQARAKGRAVASERFRNSNAYAPPGAPSY